MVITELPMSIYKKLVHIQAKGMTLIKCKFVPNSECVLNVTLVRSVVLSWFSMEQVVDLKAEGLWEEMLDEFQPEIVIQDWWVNEHYLSQPFPHNRLCMISHHCGLIRFVGASIDDNMFSTSQRIENTVMINIKVQILFDRTNQVFWKVNQKTKYMRL